MARRSSIDGLPEDVRRWLERALAESNFSGYQALEEMRREDARLMEEAVAIGASRGVAVTGEVLQGNVAAEIIAYATQNNIDMIVTGTKGHGALAALLMGSVTRNLISLAHVPVLVVKD